MEKNSKPSLIKLSSNKNYLVYGENKPFFWLADTWWFGATKRMTWPYPFKTLVKDRKKKGFTVIQIVVGYPPEVQINSVNAQNSSGFPFKEDGKLNKKYFDEVDEKIKYVIDQGLVPCIVGGWGYHIDVFGVDKIKKLWQEIINRYSGYPVVFCLAGELDIFNTAYSNQESKSTIALAFKKILGTLPNWVKVTILQLRTILKASKKPEDKSEKLKSRISKWKEVALFIAKNDPNKILITAHMSSQATADFILGHPNWLSINSIQSGHSKDVIPFMVRSILESPKMIINLEPWYEGILSNFDDYYQRIAFWLCILSGAKGHTYGAHGIWQMADKDNFMGHWGKSDWRRAKDFPGAKQLGKSVRLIQDYEWWKLSPNFKIINPSWNSNNPMGPVAAEIKNKHIFVYFPNIKLEKKFSLSLPAKRGKYEISWIDTKTLTTIKKEGLNDKNLTFPKRVGSKDILCIISHKRT